MKITDGHKDQIKSMRKDNNTYAEIRKFFKENYNIKLYDSEIANACRDSGIPKELGPKKRKTAIRIANKVISIECRFIPICKFSDICNISLCKFNQ